MGHCHFGYNIKLTPPPPPGASHPISQNIVHGTWITMFFGQKIIKRCDAWGSYNRPIIKFALNCLINLVTSGLVTILQTLDHLSPLFLSLATITTINQELFAIMCCKFNAHSLALATNINVFTNF
jgi:hypothetical protein